MALKQAHKRKCRLEVTAKKDQGGESGNNGSLLFSKDMHGADTEGELVRSMPIRASSLHERMANVVSGSSKAHRSLSIKQ